MIELLHIDCMEYMKGLADKAFDLAIVDPPYGIGNFSQDNKAKWNFYKWNEKTPGKDYFSELERVSKERIIWGANYYNCFEGGNGAIIWNKENPHPDMSDCEIASISSIKTVKYFYYAWGGVSDGIVGRNRKEKSIHPCQKPVQLYKWLLHNYAKPGDKILDTHSGSGSIAIACHDMGFSLVGCEIDKDYYDAACKRFKQQTMQLKLIA